MPVLYIDARFLKFNLFSTGVLHLNVSTLCMYSVNNIEPKKVAIIRTEQSNTPLYCFEN
jgi:hypothetical protein